MKARSSNYYLIGSLAAIIFLGILILASVSFVFSQEKFGYTTYFLFHQIGFGLIPGLILGYFVFKTPLSFFKKWAFVIFIINLIILGLVFIPKIGLQTGGASRWINLGQFSFQPAEFLKFSFIIYLAAWLPNFTKTLTSRQGKSKNVNSMFAALLVIMGALGLLLIFQPNVGTLGIIFTTALLMYFGSGTPLLHTALMILMGFGLLLGLIKIAPYRMSRFLVFLNPDIDPLGIGYQLKQSLIAVGSGGILGLGIGYSRQKFGFLPQSIGDSIFSIFAEEAGFIGAIFLIFLFLLFAWQGFKVLKNVSDKFSQLAALGIVSWICIQAFVNIGTMIGILPLTGIPLPFISYGGSHLMAELIGAGLLLNIAKNTN